MISSTAILADPPPSPPVDAAYQADLTSDGYVNNLTRVWCWRPVPGGVRMRRMSLTQVVAT